MKIINQNILEVEQGIVVIQVNCQKVMGAGLALKIRQKYPKVYDEYRKMDWSLGKIQLVKIKEDLHICNLAGQHGFGRAKFRYTDYKAIRKGLKSIKFYKDMFLSDLNIFIPYGMGCGLGNGNWNFVSKIIKDEIPEAIICKYQGEN
jgi:hypothetical protein